MPRATKPKLSVVGEQPSRPDLPGLPPPDHLDEIGRQLWSEVTAIYAFDDPASVEVLAQACCARSRAARCAALIDEHGEMVQVGKTLRANPLLRDELQNRALCCRLLAKLGLDLEPVHPTPGRPSGRVIEMPTKRRKIVPRRIAPIPAWVQRMLASKHQVLLDPDEWSEYVAWFFFDAQTPGFPSVHSPEGRRFWFRGRQRRVKAAQSEDHA